MMADSINTNTVKIFEAGEDTARMATVTYDAASNKATLDPRADLRRGDRYRVWSPPAPRTRRATAWNRTPPTATRRRCGASG
jgi:hypothetical protein